jgi:hypothetical protein
MCENMGRMYISVDVHILCVYIIGFILISSIARLKFLHPHKQHANYIRVLSFEM